MSRKPYVHVPEPPGPIKLAFRWWPTYAGVMLAVPLGCFLSAGREALLGALLGVFGTGFSVFGTWCVTYMAKISAEHGEPPKTAVIWTGIVFLIKLPVFFLCSWAVWAIGGPGPGCFAIGLLSIYALLVAYAVATTD